MPKTDDTGTIPEVLNAPWLKRFFKHRLNLPVRVSGAKGKWKARWVQVWIESDRSVDHRHGLVYHHHFPAELGNRCMRLVYADSEKLREQSWGGNIQEHSISIHSDQLRTLLQGIIDHPLN
jgi:hypothetical protein